MDEQYQKLHTALEGEDVLNLTYENDIMQDPVRAYKKVCNWLELEEKPVKINLARTNNRGLNEVVENWGEVVSTLEGTDYAWMVEE